MRKTHTEIHLRNEPKHGHKEYKYLYQQMLKMMSFGKHIRNYAKEKPREKRSST